MQGFFCLQAGSERFVPPLYQGCSPEIYFEIFYNFFCIFFFIQTFFLVDCFKQYWTLSFQKRYHIERGWLNLPGSLTQTFFWGWSLAGAECRCWTWEYVLIRIRCWILTLIIGQWSSLSSLLSSININLYCHCDCPLEWKSSLVGQISSGMN